MWNLQEPTAMPGRDNKKIENKNGDIDSNQNVGGLKCIVYKVWTPYIDA